MKMNTYVKFAGKCADAFHFYEQHLGGKIGMMITHRWKDAVLHARVTIAGRHFLGFGLSLLKTPFARPDWSVPVGNVGADVRRVPRARRLTRRDWCLASGYARDDHLDQRCCRLTIDRAYGRVAQPIRDDDIDQVPGR
jgi:hypothetical protein